MNSDEVNAALTEAPVADDENAQNSSNHEEELAKIIPMEMELLLWLKQKQLVIQCRYILIIGFMPLWMIGTEMGL